MLTLREDVDGGFWPSASSAGIFIHSCVLQILVSPYAAAIPSLFEAGAYRASSSIVPRWSRNCVGRRVGMRGIAIYAGCWRRPSKITVPVLSCCRVLASCGRRSVALYYNDVS